MASEKDVAKLTEISSGSGIAARLAKKALNKIQKKKMRQDALTAAYDGLNASEKKLGELGDTYLENSEKTVDERFGDTIQTVRDRSAGESAANRRSVSRAMQVGGDITGSGSVIGNAMSESANEIVGDVETSLALQNEAINRGYYDAYGNVIGDTVALNADKRNFAYGMISDRKQRKLQKSVAKKQMIAGIIGGGLGLGAAALES